MKRWFSPGAAAAASRARLRSGVRRVIEGSLALGGPGAQVQADESLLGVAQVADDAAQGLRQAAHQRRDRDDLIPDGELRLLQEVDDLDAVATGEVLLADPLEVGEGGDGPGRLAGDVEPQLPGLLLDLGFRGLLVSRRGGFAHAWCSSCGLLRGRGVTVLATFAPSSDFRLIPMRTRSMRVTSAAVFSSPMRRCSSCDSASNSLRSARMRAS